MNALNYHEQKVTKGVAECLHAENFLLESHQMKFSDKLSRFKDQIDLCNSVRTTLLHASLNFDPSETFSKEELIEIANSYMDKIGFANQPYLVYSHQDAGHPHIHILTTTIKDDGNPIYVHNIGRNESEKARTEIETEFGLIKAEGQKNRPDYHIQPVSIEKALYGKSETKRSIINVLDTVLNSYKYTSLAELNAILQLGNVLADPGKPGGRINRNSGLVYRILDEHGNKIGKPIKSSSIYSMPTLSKLELNFKKNKLRRYPNRTTIKEEITKVLEKSSSIQEFTSILSRQKIDVVLRRNESGMLYGITFIDHKSKSVFNGGDLGKELSASKIQQKFNTALPVQESSLSPITSPKTTEKRTPKDPAPRITKRKKEFKFSRISQKSQTQNELIRQYDLLKQILESEKLFNQTPFELTRKKRKKKKKRNPNS